MDLLQSVEVTNCTITVTPDGLAAVLSLWTADPDPRHIQATMDRDLLERLCLLAERELRQKPKPLRHRT
jgi:hypothetical protein